MLHGLKTTSHYQYNALRLKLQKPRWKADVVATVPACHCRPKSVQKPWALKLLTAITEHWKLYWKTVVTGVGNFGDDTHLVWIVKVNCSSHIEFSCHEELDSSSPRDRWVVWVSSILHLCQFLHECLHRLEKWENTMNNKWKSIPILSYSFSISTVQRLFTLSSERIQAEFIYRSMPIYSSTHNT